MELERVVYCAEFCIGNRRMIKKQQKADEISVGFLSYEFPPKIFGGVGVHVSELTRHLAESIQHVHVFTSHVEGLNSQKAGSVYVHRSSKPLVKSSNRSGNLIESITTNGNVAGMGENHISVEKLDLLNSHGGLIHVAATQAINTTHQPLMMTAHSSGINSPNPNGPSVVMEQNGVSEVDRSIAVSGYVQRELKQTFGVNVLDGRKAGSVPAHRLSKPLVPSANYSRKDLERTMTNVNVAEMVEKHISSEKLDLLHSHGGLIQMAATEAKNMTHLPLVMTAHSTEINRVRPDKLSLLMEQNVVGEVDRFIAVSKSMRTELNRTFGIDSNKITVIPNGVDSALFKHQNADDVRSKYQLDNRFVVLFVGRDDPQKGAKRLVDAVKDLAKQIPEIMVVMVGQKDIYSDKHILCLPRVSRSELVKLYSLSDVFVLPSIYEPFGIVLLEAMACETACIGIRTGGIPDIIDHNRTGLLVEPENARGLSEAISDLYHDPEKRHRMAKNGRNRVVSHFDWNSISAKTIGVYKQVLH